MADLSPTPARAGGQARISDIRWSSRLHAQALVPARLFFLSSRTEAEGVDAVLPAWSAFAKELEQFLDLFGDPVGGEDPRDEVFRHYAKWIWALLQPTPPSRAEAEARLKAIKEAADYPGGHLIHQALRRAETVIDLFALPDDRDRSPVRPVLAIVN